jgi:hypothetical protein
LSLFFFCFIFPRSAYFLFFGSAGVIDRFFFFSLLHPKNFVPSRNTPICTYALVFPLFLPLHIYFTLLPSPISPRKGRGAYLSSKIYTCTPVASFFLFSFYFNISPF